jgi:IBR domain, a half RING-finger domain
MAALKPIYLDDPSLHGMQHLGIPPIGDIGEEVYKVEASDQDEGDELENVVSSGSEQDDPDLSSESSDDDDDDDDDDDGVSWPPNEPIGGVGGFVDAISEKTEKLEKMALSASGRRKLARGELTASAQHRQHIYAGELTDMREKLELLISRYAARDDVVLPLVDVRNELQMALDTVGYFDANEDGDDQEPRDDGVAVVAASSSSAAPRPRAGFLAGSTSVKMAEALRQSATLTRSARVNIAATTPAVSEATSGSDVSSGSSSDGDDTPAPAAARQEAPKCTSLHTLSLKIGPAPVTSMGWYCDVCRGHFAVDVERWRCDACDYDECFACQPRIQVAASSDAEPAQVDRTLETCPICFDDYYHPSAQTDAYEECGHMCCVECRRDHYVAVINGGGVLDMMCTQPGCEHEVTAAEVDRIVDDETFGRYQQFLLLAQLRTRNDVCWCPNPDCDAYVEGVDANNTTVALECGNCQTHICPRCQQQDHPDEPDCGAAEREHDKRNNKLTRKQRRRMKKDERYVKRRSQLCWSCGARVQKTSGCRYVVVVAVVFFDPNRLV